MNRVTHYTKAEAKDFFERFAAYSAEYVRVAMKTLHPHWPTGNCYDEWLYEHPIGHILHFTAGVKYSGTIRHFVLGHRASSNWVIAKALDRRFDALRKELELDNDLRAEAVQVVPPYQPSWHAGHVNRYLAGTEIRNAGILRPCLKGKSPNPENITRDEFFKFGSHDVEDLDFYWWPEQWTTKIPAGMKVIRIKTSGGVSFWESFSRGSLATVITILRYLNALYPESLDPLWMLAHHNVNPHKNDVVLPVDLHELRSAVLFDKTHVDDLVWLAEYDDVEDGFKDDDDPWMIQELDERQADRAEEDIDDFDPRRIEGVIDTPHETIEALHRLGYYVGGVEVDPNLVRRSVRIFQRGRGLKVDGDAGPATNGRLDRELKSWRIK